MTRFCWLPPECWWGTQPDVRRLESQRGPRLGGDRDLSAHVDQRSDEIARRGERAMLAWAASGSASPWPLRSSGMNTLPHGFVWAADPRDLAVGGDRPAGTGVGAHDGAQKVGAVPF